MKTNRSTRHRSTLLWGKKEMIVCWDLAKTVLYMVCLRCADFYDDDNDDNGGRDSDASDSSDHERLSSTHG